MIGKIGGKEYELLEAATAADGAIFISDSDAK